jgi:hypothetical protein
MHGVDCSALQLQRITIAVGSKFEYDGCELETCSLARARVEIVLDSCPRSIKRGAQSANGAWVVGPYWVDGRRDHHDKTPDRSSGERVLGAR